MKSACCKHEIVIQTDPKNCEYVIISGAQKKTEDFDIEDAETFELPADEGVYNSISENFLAVYVFFKLKILILRMPKLLNYMPMKVCITGLVKTAVCVFFC